MAEYIPAAISIGGNVPRALATELAQMMIDAGALPEFEGEVPVAPTVEWLLSAVDVRTGLVELANPDARWGNFEALEDWLIQQSIPFDRVTEARYEFDGAVVSYRPGVGIVEHLATQDGDAEVLVYDLEEVRDFLREALRQRSPEKVRAALAALEKIMGPQIPSLPPFALLD